MYSGPLSLLFTSIRRTFPRRADLQQQTGRDGFGQLNFRFRILNPRIMFWGKLVPSSCDEHPSDEYS